MTTQHHRAARKAGESLCLGEDARASGHGGEFEHGDGKAGHHRRDDGLRVGRGAGNAVAPPVLLQDLHGPVAPPAAGLGSEEHTSELQSLMRISYAVFCLKKKTVDTSTNTTTTQRSK